MAERGGGWWPDRPEKGSEESDGDGEQEPDRRAGSESGGTEPGQGPPQHRPPRGLASRDRPKIASRYSMFVGLAFIALAIVAVINAIGTDEGGVLGADSEAVRGTPVAEFAAPNVLTGPAGDANIDQDDCESSRNPCPDDQVRVPACQVEVEGAIRVCDLFDKPLALSFWFTRGGDCIPTQDAFDRVASQRSDVNFLSINVLDDRDQVAEIVRARGWEVPVAHDSDGAVSNIFGVGVCPTILLAYPGGILHSAEIKPGNFTSTEIDRLVDDLVAASAGREPDASLG